MWSPIFRAEANLYKNIDKVRKDPCQEIEEILSPFFMLIL